MSTLNKISLYIEKIISYVLIVCFTVMSITYFGQIVLRYVFQTGFHWTEELTRYTNIIMVMFGSALLAGKQRHINVTALEMLLPGKAQRAIKIFQQILSLVFFAIVIQISLNMADLAGTQVSTNMRMPMAIIYYIFAVAFSVAVFQVIVHILNEVLRKETV